MHDAKALVVAALIGGGCGSPAAPPAATPEAAAPAPVVVATSANVDAAPPPPSFNAGCDGPLPKVLPARVKLGDDADWTWACRAADAFGEPHLRRSGYPDFKIKDAESGACMTLSIEQGGGAIYYAPPGRGEALKAFLLARPAVRDCSFEVDIDGFVPGRIGVRGGASFSEYLYKLTTLEGNQRYFEEHPNEASAGGFISAWLETEAKARPAVAPLLERAAIIELDIIDKMERGMLSDIGQKGYCKRSRDLAKLPTSAAVKARIAGEVRRFC